MVAIFAMLPIPIISIRGFRVYKTHKTVLQEQGASKYLVVARMHDNFFVRYVVTLLIVRTSTLWLPNHTYKSRLVPNLIK